MTVLVGGRELKAARVGTLPVDLHLGSALLTVPELPPFIAGAAGHRRPYSSYPRITSEQAAEMGDVSGHLIMGAAPVGTYGTDVIVEANRRVETLLAGKGPWDYLTVSGLERDPDGTPLELHPVRQGLMGSGYKVDRSVIQFTNDGWANAQSGYLRRSVVKDHCFYVHKGDLQHRDGCQPYGGGDWDCSDNEFWNDAPEWPVGRDGERVPVSGGEGNWEKNRKRYVAGPADASSSVMLNHDNPYSKGPVTIRRNVSHGGNSVHFNISGDSDPGRFREDGVTPEEWCVPVYKDGVLVLGMIMEGNVSHMIRADGTQMEYIIRCTAPQYRPLLFPNATTWKWNPTGNLGDSSAFSVVIGDGEPRRVLRREVIY